MSSHDRVAGVDVLVFRTLGNLMANMLNGVIAALLILIATFGTAGCSSYRTVHSNDANLLYDVTVGDKVKIRTKQGERHEFQVTKITQESIIGNDIEIGADEIASIEKMEFDAQLTGAAVATTAAVGYLVYVTIAVIAGLAALAAL